MKMLKHALSGVTEGRTERGVPVEVMGLLLGKPEGNSIIVTDVFPLPVKGIEYEVQVMEKSLAFMTQIQEALELRRNDRFVGWYHSHPFEVEAWSHCHLSAIDVGTQLAWQASSPWWLAIVVDPLRSLFRSMPDMGAYRCYPAAYDPPASTLPDGSVAVDPQWTLQRWGNSYSRYYELNIEYFTSSVSNALLQSMRKELWSMPLIPTTCDSESLQTSNDILAGLNRVMKQLNQGDLRRQWKTAQRLLTKNSTSTETTDRQSVPEVTTKDELKGNHTETHHKQVPLLVEELSKQAVRECCSHSAQILRTLLFSYTQRSQDESSANTIDEAEC